MKMLKIRWSASGIDDLIFHELVEDTEKLFKNELAFYTQNDTEFDSNNEEQVTELYNESFEEVLKQKLGLNSDYDTSTFSFIASEYEIKVNHPDQLGIYKLMTAIFPPDVIPEEFLPTKEKIVFIKNASTKKIEFLKNI